MTILIFKTNIRFKKDLKKIEPVLNNIEDVVKWNIDRQDIDNVLRVEAKTNNLEEIINSVKQEGYLCEELPD